MRARFPALLPVAIALGLIASPTTTSAAGNPDGHVLVPVAARAVDTSHPDHVIGNGTAASCTSAKFVAAVAKGGIIRFRCGPGHVTIHMTATAKVFNNKPDVVIDG